MNEGLLQKLKKHAEEGFMPMHMPGHKRNEDFLCGLPVDIDITEIEGFDNLHDMRGVLKETAQLAEELFGGEACFPLVNGSSVGILAAVTAATGGQGTLIMARNCHRSCYNAAAINRLNTAYIYPHCNDMGIYGAVSPKEVEKALEDNPDSRAVIITSPTFEGVVSDVSAIAEVCHSHGAKLIVDEAHGAHFGFSDKFPQNAITLGADFVIMSLHKTLPAMTQCALIAGKKEYAKQLAYAISLYETTSPSYVLLSAIDSCLRTVRQGREELFSGLYDNLKKFYENTPLNKLSLIHFDDASRIIVSCKNADINGERLAEILREEYKIEVEMAYADYVVMISTVCDKPESFDRLSYALTRLDSTLDYAKSEKKTAVPPRAEGAMPLFAAHLKEGEEVSLKDCADRICAEYIFAYPPGVPVLAPGEVVSKDTAEFLLAAKQCGIELHGMKSEKDMIYVLQREK